MFRIVPENESLLWTAPDDPEVSILHRPYDGRKAGELMEAFKGKEAADRRGGMYALFKHFILSWEGIEIAAGEPAPIDERYFPQLETTILMPWYNDLLRGHAQRGPEREARAEAERKNS